MYVAGFVIPVLAAKMEAYRKWAETSAAFFRDYGCLEIVESWEDKVPRGKLTDFHRAVAAREDEKIVFSWQIWPSRNSWMRPKRRCIKTRAWRCPPTCPSMPGA